MRIRLISCAWMCRLDLPPRPGDICYR